MIAYTAAYYGQDPLKVESWKTTQVYEWYNEAINIENEKAKAYNNSQINGKES